MNIEKSYLPDMTIEEFAEVHGLTMKVVERNVPVGSESRYYAHFKGAETKSGAILSSEAGNGRTPEEAIADYADRLNLKYLIIDAYQPTRREIMVGRLRPNSEIPHP